MAKLIGPPCPECGVGLIPGNGDNNHHASYCKLGGRYSLVAWRRAANDARILKAARQILAECMLCELGQGGIDLVEALDQRDRLVQSSYMDPQEDE